MKVPSAFVTSHFRPAKIQNSVHFAAGESDAIGPVYAMHGSCRARVGARSIFSTALPLIQQRSGLSQFFASCGRDILYNWYRKHKDGLRSPLNKRQVGFLICRHRGNFNQFDRGQELSKRIGRRVNSRQPHLQERWLADLTTRDHEDQPLQQFPFYPFCRSQKPVALVPSVLGCTKTIQLRYCVRVFRLETVILPVTLHSLISSMM